MLSINLRRGLFRLWIATSFVWLVIVGALSQEGIRWDVSTLTTDRPAAEERIDSRPLREQLLRTCRDEPRDKRGCRKKERSAEERKKARAQQAQSAQGELMLSAIVLLLPPILAFALGWAGLWIMRGFRS